MRKRIATTWFVGLVLIAWSLQVSFAQRRMSSAEDGLAYVYSAFLTQADAGVMSSRVAVGPELQKGLSLPSSV
jgi:hypothetical protein